MSCFFCQHGGICCCIMILFFSLQCTIFQFLQCFHQQVCPHNCHFVMYRCKSIFWCNFHFFFEQHITTIQTFCHIHSCNTCHCFPIYNCPLHRSCPTIFWQQRTMHIDTAIFRYRQYIFCQYLAKCCYCNQIWLIFPQFFHKFRFTHLCWLQYRNIVLQCTLFYRRKCHFFPSAFWFIWLCHNKHYFMILQQCLQRRYCKIWCSHKYHTHVYASLFRFIIW